MSFAKICSLIENNRNQPDNLPDNSIEELINELRVDLAKHWKARSNTIKLGYGDVLEKLPPELSLGQIFKKLNDKNLFVPCLFKSLNEHFEEVLSQINNTHSSEENLKAVDQALKIIGLFTDEQTFTQNLLIKHMQDLGYDITSEGVCYGITQMTRIAFLNGTMDEFNEILHWAAFPKDLDSPQAKRMVVNTRALFDGIFLHQYPEKNLALFRDNTYNEITFHEQEDYISHNKAVATVLDKSITEPSFNKIDSSELGKELDKIKSDESDDDLISITIRGTRPHQVLTLPGKDFKKELNELKSLILIPTYVKWNQHIYFLKDNNYKPRKLSESVPKEVEALFKGANTPKLITEDQLITLDDNIPEYSPRGHAISLNYNKKTKLWLLVDANNLPGRLSNIPPIEDIKSFLFDANNFKMEVYKKSSKDNKAKEAHGENPNKPLDKESPDFESLSRRYRRVLANIVGKKADIWGLTKEEVTNFQEMIGKIKDYDHIMKIEKAFNTVLYLKANKNNENYLTSKLKIKLMSQIIENKNLARSLCILDKIDDILRKKNESSNPDTKVNSFIKMNMISNYIWTLFKTITEHPDLSQIETLLTICENRYLKKLSEEGVDFRHQLIELDEIEDLFKCDPKVNLGYLKSDVVSLESTPESTQQSSSKSTSESTQQSSSKSTGQTDFKYTYKNSEEFTGKNPAHHDVNSSKQPPKTANSNNDTKKTSINNQFEDLLDKNKINKGNLNTVLNAAIDGMKDPLLAFKNEKFREKKEKLKNIKTQINNEFDNKDAVKAHFKDFVTATQEQRSFQGRIKALLTNQRTETNSFKVLESELNKLTLK